jgi:hypothetical protein
VFTFPSIKADVCISTARTKLAHLAFVSSLLIRSCFSLPDDSNDSVLASLGLQKEPGNARIGMWMTYYYIKSVDAEASKFPLKIAHKPKVLTEAAKPLEAQSQSRHLCF